MKLFSKYMVLITQDSKTSPSFTILQMSWWARSPLEFVLYIYIIYVCQNQKLLCMVLLLHFPSLVMYNRIFEGRRRR